MGLHISERFNNDHYPNDINASRDSSPSVEDYQSLYKEVNKLSNLDENVKRAMDCLNDPNDTPEEKADKFAHAKEVVKNAGSDLNDLKNSGSELLDSNFKLDNGHEMTFMELVSIMLDFVGAVNNSLNAQAKQVSGHTNLITFNNNLKDALNSLNGIVDLPKRPDGSPQELYCDMVDCLKNNRMDDPVVKGLSKFMQFLENNIDPDLKKKIDACNGDWGKMKTVMDDTMNKLDVRISNVRDKINPKGVVEKFDIENISRGEEGFKDFNKQLNSLDGFTTTIATQVTSVNQDDSANLQTLQTSLSAASELLSKILAAIKEILRTLTS